MGQRIKSGMDCKKPFFFARCLFRAHFRRWQSPVPSAAY
jgi:hypothetical protein